MTRHEELVKALRCDAGNQYTSDAAAIEALQAQLEDRTNQDEKDKILEALRNAPVRPIGPIEPMRIELLPKRGEWIYEDLDNFRKYKVTCPHCGAWFVGNYDAYDEPSEFLYCPHCGNICNPTNLDWENELKEREKEARAKMEVQDGKNEA